MDNDFMVEGVRFKWLRYSNIDELKKKYFVHHVDFFITEYVDYNTNKVFFGINCTSSSAISKFEGKTIYFLHDLCKDSDQVMYNFRVEYTIHLNSGIVSIFKKSSEQAKSLYINRGYPFLLFKDSKDYAKFKIKL